MQAVSLINGGLLRGFLKRFWPLWLVFFFAWVFLYVVPLFGMIASVAPQSIDALEVADSQRSAWCMVQLQTLPITWAIAIVAALYLNERLFTAKAATFYGSLPLRRRTVFATTVLAMFLPMVLVEILVAGILLAITSTSPGIDAAMVGGWLVLVVAFSFVFCALAQLMCEITGSRSVAAFLYLLANVLAVCIVGAVMLILSALQYGIPVDDTALNLASWASPAVGMLSNCLWWGSMQSANWVALGVYCLMGVAFLALAHWLDGRRELEAAGEAVAFGVLRPVLKYLAGICSALLFGGIVCVFFWIAAGNGIVTNVAGVVAMAAAMAIGAILGVMFAQMTLTKSAMVFDDVWKGGLVLAGASVALVLACYVDPMGVTRYVPQPADVERVELVAYGMEVAEVSSEDEIEAACALHRHLIDNRDALLAEAAYLNDEYAGGSVLGFQYQLKDGSSILRSYPVCYRGLSDGAGEGQKAAYEALMSANAIANGKEARYSRLQQAIDSPDDFEFEVYRYGLDGPDAETGSVILSKAQARDFVKSALVPDVEQAAAGKVGYFTVYAEQQADGGEDALPATIASVDIRNREGSGIASFEVDAVNTPAIVRWMEENLG